MFKYSKPWLIALFDFLFFSTPCISSTNIAIHKRITIGTNTMPLVQFSVRSLLAASVLCNNNRCLFVCTLNNSYYMPNFTLATAPAPINGTMTCYSTQRGKMRFDIATVKASYNQFKIIFNSVCEQMFIEGFHKIMLC